MTPSKCGGTLQNKIRNQESSFVVKNKTTANTTAQDEKAETLWEIFEKTGSIGAYILYCEHVDRSYLPSCDEEKTPSK